MRPDVLKTLLLAIGALLVACSIAPTAAADTKAPNAAPARADRTEALPKRLNGVDVTERLDTNLPLNLGFKDEAGKAVTLRDYFGGDRPVVITMNYSDCPMLCSLQLNGFVESLKQLDWTAGQEFRIVTVSLNPKESPERALKTQSRYLTQYGRPEARDGWHFLTGSEQNARALADALGFSYGYNEKRDEWVHPAAIVVATPNGKIARYLYGIEYHPKTLRLSLVESSEGKIGSTMDRLILFCFHYDETEGRYAPVARNIMKAGGVLAVVILGAFLGALWLAESRKKKLELRGSET